MEFIFYDKYDRTFYKRFWKKLGNWDKYERLAKKLLEWDEYNHKKEGIGNV
ncbi:hypothetical protein PP654_gp061 [Bacillus phage v_B-Bak10]|uniref:Uncharacterized protein n=1 Tax=Bacillus phage v_B-Bak10 TaxID=2094736 RepID=A0A385IK79_9CAUD|nr:hypothetical protein PP654_gp061 [Bacillus phage v_B-Bak10]AXY83305.1 hypothetical protein vBBBak10_081 [Bacillus phage v_B-Bak10]